MQLTLFELNRNDKFILLTYLNGEVGWLSVEIARLQTRSIGDTLIGDRSRVNQHIDWRVLDVVVQQWQRRVAQHNVNVVLARVGWLVGDRPGAVAIVLDVGLDLIEVRVLNEHVEVVSSGGLLLAVREDGKDSELSWVRATVSRLQSYTVGKKH